MKKVLGIVDLHHNVSLGDLTKNRSVASVSLLGRYTFVDFIMSNYTNSGINDITILVKEKIRSLLHHFGFGQLNYSINLKTGGVSILFNEKYVGNPIYNTNINNMLENLRYIEQSDADTIIISPAHMLMSIDFRPFVAQHRESGNDISILYKKVDNAKSQFLNSYFVTINGDRALDIEINKGIKDKQMIFMETTIIKKSKLMEILKSANDISMLYSFRDFIIHNLKNTFVAAMEYQGYLKCFDSIDHYAQFSLELLNEAKRKELFQNTIYTRTYDTPPTRYGEEAKVQNSSIANGAIIHGEVINSIIGRNVIIEKGSKITNSIIQTHSIIGENVIIDKVVIDKNVTVKATKMIKGGDSFIVIPQGEKV